MAVEPSLLIVVAEFQSDAAIGELMAGAVEGGGGGLTLGMVFKRPRIACNTKIRPVVPTRRRKMKTAMTASVYSSKSAAW